MWTFHMDYDSEYVFRKLHFFQGIFINTFYIYYLLLPLQLYKTYFIKLSSCYIWKVIYRTIQDFRSCHWSETVTTSFVFNPEGFGTVDVITKVFFVYIYEFFVTIPQENLSKYSYFLQRKIFFIFVWPFSEVSAIILEPCSI